MDTLIEILNKQIPEFYKANSKLYKQLSESLQKLYNLCKNYMVNLVLLFS